jgi:predicted dienelactone hydrolase
VAADDLLGQFRVGHTRVEITLTGALGEVRPIDVDIWYPAEKQNFEDSPPATYTSRLHGVTLIPARWDPLLWKVTSKYARAGAGVAKNTRGFPVVVFSHGSVNNPNDHHPVMEYIAANGFIVAAPWHTGNTQDDGRTQFINIQAGFPPQGPGQLLPCLDELPAPCLDNNANHVTFNRARDISAVLDTLPSIFGREVDMDRVGLMGHSFGSAMAFLMTGGSAAFGGIAVEPRIDAVMGLAMIGDDVINQMSLLDVTVPALLLAGESDDTTPPARSLRVYNGIASAEKAMLVIKASEHRTMTSGFCAVAQASGALTKAQPVRAILDRQTFTNLLTNVQTNGSVLDYCGYETFTSPVDIKPITQSIHGDPVTPTNVPRTGVTSDMFAELARTLAVDFFEATLNCRHADRYLDDDFQAQYASLIVSLQRQAGHDYCDAGEPSGK